MREVTSLTDNKFLNIKEVKDPDNHVNGYQFAERRGTDSVAFICYDAKRDRVLVNKEYKPPVDEFIIGAFGGSLDKDASKVAVVVAETKEEAGFVVTQEDVRWVGRSFVSTQMNQYCYLYVVLVDADNQEEREPENAIEAMAETQWINPEEVMFLDDWKAITIWTKFTEVL